jgi:hypothetical protein
VAPVSYPTMPEAGGLETYRRTVSRWDVEGGTVGACAGRAGEAMLVSWMAILNSPGR